MKDDINIQKLAHLARIDLDEADESELTESIEGILEYVASVEEAAGEETDPEVGPVYNVLREDGQPHEPGAHREALLREAPKVDDDGFIVVPPILN